MGVGMGAIGFTLFTFVYGHFGPQLPVRHRSLLPRCFPCSQPPLSSAHLCCAVSPSRASSRRTWMR
jgi:hypothetical protein